MEELRRQAYLNALGVTPWVARGRLPGAADSTVLERPVAAEPAPVEQPQSPLSVPEEKPVPRSAPAEPVPEPPAAVPVEESGLRFTLHAFNAPGMVLLAQQADAGAPEPGREEQRMLSGLLRYLGVQDRRPRSFSWPLPGMKAQADHAHASLEAFLKRLCQDGQCDRVLCLLDQALTDELLRGARFQPHEWAGLNCLPVASLAEMFNDPVNGKGRSWRAMVSHGFQA